jgi:hypothetical protein
MRKREVALFLGGVVAIVVGGFRVYHRPGRSRQGEPLAILRETVATRLARAVAADAAPGEVLVIDYPAETREQRRLADVRDAALRKALGAGTWRITRLPPADWTPEKAGDWALATGSGAWGTDLVAWCEPSSKAVAAISFVGLPHLDAAGWGKVPPFFAETGALADDDPGLAEVRSGEVRAIAAYRRDAPPRALAGRVDEEALFAERYRWISAPGAGKVAP